MKRQTLPGAILIALPFIPVLLLLPNCDSGEDTRNTARLAAAAERTATALERQEILNTARINGRLKGEAIRAASAREDTLTRQIRSLEDQLIHNPSDTLIQRQIDILLPQLKEAEAELATLLPSPK